MAFTEDDMAEMARHEAHVQGLLDALEKRATTAEAEATRLRTAVKTTEDGWEQDVKRLRAELATVRRNWGHLRERLATVQKEAQGRKEHGDKLGALIEEILGHFTERGHPGEPCQRTGWIRETTVRAWRARARGQEGGH
ncbi:hypothetical protein [Streptomyces halstedii]|uniref:hypothetical protein n=1 Tax=Streptomyces halstedii TaxID=1944 RepID=UPI00335CE23B